MEIKFYSIKLETPPWLRRAVVYLAIPSAAILGVSALVYASVDVPNTFADGETLSAQKMNDNFTNLETGVNEAAPPGSIMAYFGATAPSGWLIADGAVVDAQANDKYAALVNHLRSLGAAYQGALTSQAKLPDLRGQFLRGQDRSAGVNPDCGQDLIGQTQDDELRSHNHTVSHVSSDNIASVGGGYSNTRPLDASYTSMTGGNETRPVNVTVLYIIKY